MQRVRTLVLTCPLCCPGGSPGLFLLNPDGELIIIDYSNSPFARPDLRILIEGALRSPHPSARGCTCACEHPLNPFFLLLCA